MSSVPSVAIVARPPSTEEYCMICAAVGWASYADPVRTAAIQGSLFHVVALADEAAVGMGRIVGDGAVFFYSQDVVVCPPTSGMASERRSPSG